MKNHTELSSKMVRHYIRKGVIGLAGNQKLRIYGHLQCTSGKRMLVKNRVFFKDEEEAQDLGFRPCGNCMREKYKLWKDESL